MKRGGPGDNKVGARELIVDDFDGAAWITEQVELIENQLGRIAQELTIGGEVIGFEDILLLPQVLTKQGKSVNMNWKRVKLPL